MITTHIFGGLGNQLFQYCCGRALSLRHNVKLRLLWDGREQENTTTRRFDRMISATPLSSRAYMASMCFLFTQEYSDRALFPQMTISYSGFSLAQDWIQFSGLLLSSPIHTKCNFFGIIIYPKTNVHMLKITVQPHLSYSHHTAGGAGQGALSAATCAMKSSPRASKLSYWSKLAAAGARSTTSPG